MTNRETSGTESRPAPLTTRVFFNLVPLVVILAGFGLFAFVVFVDFSRQVRDRMEMNQRLDLLADQVGANLSHLQSFLISNEFPRGFSTAEQEKLQEYLDEVTDDIDRLANLDTTQNSAAFFPKLRAAEEELYTALRDLSPGDSLQPKRAEWIAALNRLDRLLEEVGLANKAGAVQTEKLFDQLHRRVVTALVGGGSIAVIVAGLCCYFLARSILRPIHDLTNATSKIAEGQLDHRVSTRSADELGKLALAFNRMADRLQAFRRSQDETVVRAHQFMEATITSFPDPVFIFDQKQVLKLKNAAATDLLAAVGVHPDGIPPEIKEFLQRVFEGGESVPAEKYGDALTWRIRGRKKFFLPRAVMIERDSLVTGVALVLYDVTGFRLMDEVKSSMIGTVSHEIKTPLTSVSMVLHLLVEESVGPLSEEQRELVETALDDTTRLMDVVNDLLDMSRIEQGRVVLDFEPTDLGDWLQEVCEEFDTVLEARGQHIRLDLDEKVSQVWIDRQRMANAIRNLIENAHKYSPPDTEIELTLRQDGAERVQLSVSDRGAGIPEEIHDKVFEKFYRAPGLEEPGTGLGLSLTREIVRAHSGSITVRNRPDGGAEFTLHLRRQPHECKKEKEDSGR